MSEDQATPEQESLPKILARGTKGKAKEVAGQVTGQDPLKHEGEAELDEAIADREEHDKRSNLDRGPAGRPGFYDGASAHE
jgi:hypothetical protein